MFFVWGWIMGKLTTNRERRNDGRIRYPSSIDGKKYTTRDMVRDNKRRAFPGEKARLEAERAASKDGCFGVLLALLLGAGAIVGIAAQWGG